MWTRSRTRHTLKSNKELVKLQDLIGSAEADKPLLSKSKSYISIWKSLDCGIEIDFWRN